LGALFVAASRPAPDRSAEARALFERGVQIIDEGHFGEAMTTLEASERLRGSSAPSPGAANP
jgi:hypothetical protein